jgi:predicted nucleic acid-binding protein
MISIHQSYVVTPSVAFYGCLDLDTAIPTEQNLVRACNAFLARATFHGATLYVPMVFYSEVVQVAFTVYRQGSLTAEDCLHLTEVILETNWDYRIPSSSDILEMLFQNQSTVLSDADYLAVAQQFACPIITTPLHQLQTSAAIQILEVQQHPWANSGGLEDFPPNTA